MSLKVTINYNYNYVEILKKVKKEDLKNVLKEKGLFVIKNVMVEDTKSKKVIQINNEKELDRLMSEWRRKK